MRFGSRGFAVLATIACSAIACGTVLQAQIPEPAIAAYAMLPSDGSTDAYLPRVFKNNAGWSSHIVVQNVGSAQANVTVSFYASSATPVHTENTQIPIGAPGVLSTHDLPGLPDDFGGSVAINSDQPVMATAVSSNGAGTNAYNGFSQGSSTLHVLHLFCHGASGFPLTSILSVQNVGAQTATVNIVYSNGMNSFINVDPNRSQHIDQESHGATCTSTPEFTAKIISDQPIGAVVDVRELGFPGSWANEAQTGTTEKAVGPVAVASHGPWDSRQYPMNSSNSASEVNISYEGHEGSSQNVNLGPSELTQSVAPAAPYRGAVTVTSTQNVAGIIEIYNSETQGDLYGSYPMLGNNSQGSTLFAPMAPRGVGLQPGETFESLLEIANTGASSTNVTVTFYDSSGNAEPLDRQLSGVQALAPFSLEAGESTEIDLSSIPSGDLLNGFYSAKIESNGQPLAGAVLLTQKSTAIFSDGFESGDTSIWSSTVQN